VRRDPERAPLVRAEAGHRICSLEQAFVETPEVDTSGILLGGRAWTPTFVN